MPSIHCPFCREPIRAGAVVCRWCGRDLPVTATDGQGKNSSSWVAALTFSAVLVTAAAVVAARLFGDFLEERRHFLENRPEPPSPPASE